MIESSLPLRISRILEELVVLCAMKEAELGLVLQSKLLQGHRPLLWRVENPLWLVDVNDEVCRLCAVCSRVDLERVQLRGVCAECFKCGQRGDVYVRAR